MDLEPQRCGIVRQEMFDSWILDFNRTAAPVSHKEHTGMQVLGMGAGDKGVAALDP